MIRPGSALSTSVIFGLFTGIVMLGACGAAAQKKRPPGKLRVDPPHITMDKSVKYDYDIVYVRAPRFDTVKGQDGKEGRQR
ncbi:MAG: hypothetical protein FJ303_24515 [Planctomycetes bacterium]|nr:hypothetical protein [Planctomycetota bacterium]